MTNKDDAIEQLKFEKIVLWTLLVLSIVFSFLLIVFFGDNIDIDDVLVPAICDDLGYKHSHVDYSFESVFPFDPVKVDYLNITCYGKKKKVESKNIIIGG